MAKFIITEDGRDRIFEIVENEFTVGASEDSDVMLRDDQAAPVHVTVKRVREGYRVVDMETRIGTKVNGNNINHHVLSNGDTLEIGNAQITYLGKGPVKKKAAASRGGARASSGGSGGIRRVAAAERSARRSERRETWVDKLGPWGGVGLVVGIAGLAVLVLMMSSGGGTSKDESNLNAAVSEARHLLEAGSDDDIPAIKKNLADAERMASSKADKERVRGLKRKLQDLEGRIERVTRNEAADKLATQIHNVNLRQPNNVTKIAAMCKEFLGKYTGTPKEAKIRNILAAVSGDNVSPEQAELGKLEEKIDKAVRDRDYRSAFGMIDNAPPRLKDLYEEEFAKMENRIWQNGNKAFRLDYNDARFELREGRDAKGRELMLKVLDNFPDRTIEKYFRVPQSGYRNPKNAEAEKKAFALLKELYAERNR